MPPECDAPRAGLSHHGGRLSVKVHQLSADQAMPGDGLYAWTVCRACPNAKASPRLPLSPATCKLSLGRFLESNFYNPAAMKRPELGAWHLFE